MATTLVRKLNLFSNYRHFILSSKGPIYMNKNNTTTIISHYNHYYAQHYSKFSNLFRRAAKDIHAPATCSPVHGFKSVSRAVSGVGFVGWYLGLIKSRPLLTKSVTSSVIYAVADLTSQTIALPSSEPYDFVRTSRMAGYGLLLLGPTLHYWFNFMSKILPRRDLLTTAKKMALGQTVYAPIMTVIFFSLNAALQGENVKEIVARLRRDFIPAMVNCAIYWPFCDFVTFRFAPVHLQPLVSNGFSLVWTVYMTYMASLEKVI